MALFYLICIGFDLFSRQIKLTYKGQKSFRTKLGGITSIIILSIITIYTIRFTERMINRKTSNNSRSTAINQFVNDPEVHYPEQSGYAFGIVLLDSTGDLISLDPTILTLSLTSSVAIRDEYQNAATNVTQIPFVNWGDTFPIERTILEKSNYTNFILWPEDKNYSLTGNFVADRYDTLALSASRCQNFTSNNTCKSALEIEQGIANLKLVLVFANSYMDFDDYTNPIKQFSDDRNVYTLLSGYQK